MTAFVVSDHRYIYFRIQPNLAKLFFIAIKFIDHFAGKENLENEEKEKLTKDENFPTKNGRKDEKKGKKRGKGTSVESKPKRKRIQVILILR